MKIILTAFHECGSVHTVGCWESAIFSQVTFSQASSLAEILTPFAVFSPLFFLHNQQPLNASSSSPFECVSKNELKMRTYPPRSTHLRWLLLFPDASRNFCKFIRMPWRHKDFHWLHFQTEVRCITALAQTNTRVAITGAFGRTLTHCATGERSLGRSLHPSIYT